MTFYSLNLDLDPMTLILKLDLDMVNIEINSDLYFSQDLDGQMSQNFTYCFHCLKTNLSDKNI